VGPGVGFSVGSWVGQGDGHGVGLEVGTGLGIGVGWEVGRGVGPFVGMGLGKEGGLGVGLRVGLEVGCGVGLAVACELIGLGVGGSVVGIIVGFGVIWVSKLVVTAGAGCRVVPLNELVGLSVEGPSETTFTALSWICINGKTKTGCSSLFPPSDAIVPPSSSSA
jgi:hypothetical protein